MAAAHADDDRSVVIFHLSDRFAAVDVETVEKIVPMPELSRPPGMPGVLEGIMNLAGAAVPVMRLDRLLGLTGQRVGLYSSVLILREKESARVGILADRVNNIRSIPVTELLPVRPEDSLNGCTCATTVVEGEVIHVLSVTQLLLAKERAALAEFCQSIDKRSALWEASRD